MVMKTILYIHGLSSSGASGAARHLQALLPDIRVIAPDLPIAPDEALAMLRDLVATERPDIVIGTSMGGMFAQQLYDCRKILVNPAFHVAHDATTDRRVFFPQSAKRWCNDLYDYP